MKYNFDEIIQRENTDSIKFDFARRRGMPEDILPLWVADMDFAAPKEVIEALSAKSAHGIFGYSEGREDYFDAVANWYKKHFDWDLKPNWMIKTPGVVYAVAMAIQAYTKEGQGVLIQEPVYYPFRECIESNNRQLVVNQLVYSNNKYSINFEDFEEKIVNGNVKLFVLCSPHNPVGRVWTKEELIGLGDICVKHNVIVIADEIHGDFTYPGFKHFVFANLKEEFKNITVTATAPSKTFNLAALQISNVFISNIKLRKAFKATVRKSGYSQPNIMGLIACKAAYEHGDEWVAELKAYLKDNLDFFKAYMKENIPEAIVVEPEGTYLVWVDFSQVQAFKSYSTEKIDEFMIHKAKLWLDGGTMFGKGGEFFQRFNIACPRPRLKEALDRLKEGLNDVIIYDKVLHSDIAIIT